MTKKKKTLKQKFLEYPKSTYGFEYGTFDVLMNMPFEDFVERRKKMSHILPGDLDSVLAQIIADRFGVSNTNKRDSSKHHMALIAEGTRVPLGNSGEWDNWHTEKHDSYLRQQDAFKKK